MLSMVQSAPDIFYFNSNKMGYWLVQKALHTKYKYAINTYFVLRLWEVSQQYYAHIYSLLLLLWSWVFILPTVVLEHGWMEVKLQLKGRRQREVQEYEEQMCKCRRTEKQFIFCPLPWILWITESSVSNNPWRESFCLLRPLSETEKRGNSLSLGSKFLTSYVCSKTDS